MSIRNYFDAEMRLLNEAAQSFAKAYPEQAGQLNLQGLRDRDPSVERLLEGFAYLTAQIRMQMDAGLPEISSHLIRQFFPALLSPFPSVTIIEFGARKQQCQKSFVLPRGSIVESSPVGPEKTICRFMTNSEVILSPITLKEVKKSEPLAGGTLMSFYFECDKTVELAALDLKCLNLYLHADPSITLELYWALVDKVSRSVLKYSNKTISLGIKPHHFKSSDSLLNVCDDHLLAFHLLLDYFAFREKYFFVEFYGINFINEPSPSHQFVIEVYLDHVFDKNIQFNPSQFRLHCVPAINIAPYMAEPIRLQQQRYDYPLTVDVGRKESVFLQSIDEVKGINHRTGEQILFHPMDSYLFRESNEPYYQIHVKDFGNPFLDQTISFSTTADFSYCDVSLTVKVNNGHYPRLYLQENSIHQMPNQPHFLIITNITRPTPLLFCPENKNAQWQLISCLSLNVQSIMNAQKLQRMLLLFEWTGREEQHKKINSILRIESKPMTEIMRGVLIHGLEIRLWLKESEFSSEADLFLFGKILHEFFQGFVPLNLYLKLKIISEFSQREWQWKTVCAKKALL